MTIRGGPRARRFRFYGAFPIVGRVAANTIVYANPEFEAETLPATATHVHLAGAGPTPMIEDPGYLADDAAASFALAPGGGNHFAAFTAAASNVGDDFTMTEAELAKLTAVPVDGSAFTVTCDGGSCGAAAGSLLLLVTTDTSTAGMSPFAMPLPTTKRVMIRCAAIGQTSVTVPAAYMAAIMTSGYRRIQATFMRPALMTGGPASVNALSGHAIVGFTNRPAS